MVTQPANSVLVSGNPIIDTDLRLDGTLTYAAPKRLVKEGAGGSGYVQVCGDEGKALGVLGYREAHPSQIEDHTIATTYATGDRPPVLKGSFRGVFILKASQGALVSGQKLSPAANGAVKKQPAITSCHVCILDKPVSNSASEQDVIAIWTG